MVYYRDELYHHGIKGMKWGVRRYQNPDGSYTSAGRLRYGIKSAADKVKTNVKDAYERVYNDPVNVARREKNRQRNEELQKYYAKKERKAAARKRAKEKLQRDPYGANQKYPNIDQKLNRSRDESRFGKGAPTRIQKQIDSGKTYKQAVRGEKRAKALMRTAEWLLLDEIFTGGKKRRFVEDVLYETGKVTVNTIKNAAKEQERRRNTPKIDVERAWDVDRQKWVEVK